LAGCEKKEWQVGVMVGSYVGHNGRGLRAAFEGSRIVGVKKSKELGQSNCRSARYSVLHVTGGSGSCHHTPIGAVILGADRGLHGKKGIEHIVYFNHFVNTACRQFGGASGVESGDLGTDETFWASVRHCIGT